ncbi:MAG: hypothetical protein ACLFSE_04380 [Spirochaetia bacterium]
MKQTPVCAGAGLNSLSSGFSLTKTSVPLKLLELHWMALRTNQGWNILETWQRTIYGEVQETHLWAYSLWMTEDYKGDDTVIIPVKR